MSCMVPACVYLRDDVLYSAAVLLVGARDAVWISHYLMEVLLASILPCAGLAVSWFNHSFWLFLFQLIFRWLSFSVSYGEFIPYLSLCIYSVSTSFQLVLQACLALF